MRIIQINPDHTMKLIDIDAAELHKATLAPVDGRVPTLFAIPPLIPAPLPRLAELTHQDRRIIVIGEVTKIDPTKLSPIDDTVTAFAEAIVTYDPSYTFDISLPAETTAYAFTVDHNGTLIDFDVDVWIELARTGEVSEQ